MEEKQYYEVFHKDNRNQQGNRGAKKRNNVKEAARRQTQQEKRGIQRGEIEAEEASESEEWEQPKSKYNNGKKKK